MDLVREIIRPVCDKLFEHLLGVGVPSDDGISASQIFDLYLSLNRRKEIVAKAGAMLETYTEAQDSLNTAPGYATSLRMLGYDLIAGSLAGSLLHELKNAQGKRLCDISYPQNLPKTGVPYIERFASADCTAWRCRDQARRPHSSLSRSGGSAEPCKQRRMLFR